MRTWRVWTKAFGHRWRCWPERKAARYLRSRGWVVFYLDPQVRQCQLGQPDGCWLELYERSQSGRQRVPYVG